MAQKNSSIFSLIVIAQVAHSKQPIQVLILNHRQSSMNQIRACLLL